MSILNKVIASVVRKIAVSKGQKIRENLDKITESPMSVQEDFLMKLLADNRETEYGKEFKFSSITSIEEYRKSVPITSYSHYQDYINRMFLNGESNLITSYPVKHFSESSGTTGEPKKIPHSEVSARISSEYMVLYFIAILKKNALDLSSRGIMLVESNLDVLESGATYGAYSARKMKESAALCDAFFTTPKEAMFPQEEMNVRYLQALYALKEKDVSFAYCAFNCYMLELLHFMEKNSEMLIKDIEYGTIDSSINLPQNIRKRLEKKLKSDPKRAAELREVFRQSSKGIVPKIWPNFKFLVGIGTAYFSVYTEKLKEYFGPNISFYLYGYVASEGVFSVPLGMNTGESVLLPNSVFYEFLPENSINNSDETVTMDKLEVGKNYKVIISNSSGFYRYMMYDIIRVVGFYNSTPTIEFVSRSHDIINLAGEKTSEYTLREIIMRATNECGFEIQDYSVCPNTDVSPVRYDFLLEPDNDIPNDFDISQLNYTISKHLLDLGDSLFKTDILGESKVYINKRETHEQYRKQMSGRKATSQFKPVRIINDDLKKHFFYERIDKRFNYEE